VKAYKGFNKDLQCTPAGKTFQYELGKEFVHEGEVETCEGGFHSCENPMDVFSYYGPKDSRYCEVEADGDISKESGGDSKIASRRIKIGLEIGIKGIVEAGVKFIFSQVDWVHAKESNTGYKSASTNTGNYSASTNTGYKSASTNTGNYSASTVEGKDSIALATGIGSKARGALGCYIVVAEWEKDDNYDWHIKDVQAAKVDGNAIKADTFYSLVEGQFKEADLED